jgi:hypothetical protein
MDNNKREGRAAVQAGWIAAAEGMEVYLSEEADPELFHLRKDCPKVGATPIAAHIENGIITDAKKFFYRDVVPCDRCFKTMTTKT